MKKITLLASLLLTAGALNAQINESDQPAIGAAINLYVIDSSAAEMANVTGSAVTWDYSTYGGYGGALVKSVENVDPTTTTNASDYTTSTDALVVEDGITRYTNSTSAGMVSQGYSFYEASFGNVRLILDTDEADLAAYPMNLGDEVVDAYQGTLHYTFNQIPQASQTVGTIRTHFDGEGTLELADGNSFANVKRITTIDSSFSTVPAFGTIVMVRRQYDYYDYSTSNLPIFSLIYFKLGLQGASPLTESTVVLSSILPQGFVSVEEVACSTCDTKIYPNPATNVVNIKAGENITANVYSMTGQLVETLKVKKGTTTKLDVSEYNQGVYLIKIEGTQTRKVERVVIQ